MRLHEGDVDAVAAPSGGVRRCDLVVLDPPRTGAGRGGGRAAIAALRPRAVAYVACDPAALARDLGDLRGPRATQLAALRAFDLFPMTHHVECVATLAPARRRAGHRSSHSQCLTSRYGAE